MSIEWIAALILFFASIVQSSSGFGLALLAMPALVFFKVPVPVAVVIVTLGSFLQTGVACFQLREHIDWKEVIRVMLWRTAFLPIGILALKWSTFLSPEKIESAMGAVILLVLAMQFFGKKMDLSSPLKSSILFAISGFMAGAIGIGGPALVLWVTLRGWSPLRSRAFLLANFFISIPIGLLLLATQLPDEFNQALPLSLLAIPFVVLGNEAGKIIAKYLSPENFKRIVYGLLIFASVGMLGSW